MSVKDTSIHTIIYHICSFNHLLIKFFFIVFSFYFTINKVIWFYHLFQIFSKLSNISCSHFFTSISIYSFLEYLFNFFELILCCFSFDYFKRLVNRLGIGFDINKLLLSLFFCFYPKSIIGSRIYFSKEVFK